MKYANETGIADSVDSYEKLELKVRDCLTITEMNYRQIAAELGIIHTKLWLFHKQNSKLQFNLLDQLAHIFNVPYYLSNRSEEYDDLRANSVDTLNHDVRLALDKTIEAGVGYRKIGEATGISHEWIRCFHVKKAIIDAKKVLSIADFLDVPYEICNGATLGTLA